MGGPGSGRKSGSGTNKTRLGNAKESLRFQKRGTGTIGNKIGSSKTIKKTQSKIRYLKKNS
jgi:hypothetical protein